MNNKDRRESRRFPIRVLVQCLPPGSSGRRNGNGAMGWEMWARDIADDGVGLVWSRRWAVQRCPHCSEILFPRKKDRQICLCSSPGAALKPGGQVKLDGLIYSDRGSVPVKGRIQWVRPGKRGATLEVGVRVTSPNHRTFFKALEG